MKALESFGHQGHLGGWINTHIQGRTLEAAMKDGQWLVLRFVDGHEAKIGWQDASGNQIKGEPFLENLDVRITVPGVQVGGAGGNL